MLNNSFCVENKRFLTIYLKSQLSAHLTELTVRAGSGVGLGHVRVGRDNVRGGS